MKNILRSIRFGVAAIAAASVIQSSAPKQKDYFPGRPLAYEITAANPDPEFFREVLDKIGRIPYKMRHRAGEFGAKIVIADEMPPSEKHLEGVASFYYKKCIDVDIDYLPGMYLYRDKQVIILQKPRSHATDIIDSEFGDTELHEAVHMVDAAYGGLSQLPSFRLVFDQFNRDYFRFHHVQNDPMCKTSSPDQAFAVLFANFYDSEESRINMERDYPYATKYFRAFEEATDLGYRLH